MLEKLIRSISFSGKRFLTTGLALGMLLGGRVGYGKENKNQEAAVKPLEKEELVIKDFSNIPIEEGGYYGPVNIYVEDQKGEKVTLLTGEDGEEGCKLETNAEGLTIRNFQHLNKETGGCIIPRGQIKNLRRGTENTFIITPQVKDDKGRKGERTISQAVLDTSSVYQEIVNFDLVNSGRYLKNNQKTTRLVKGSLFEYDYLETRHYDLEGKIKLSLPAEKEKRFFPFYLTFSGGLSLGSSSIEFQSDFGYHYSGGFGVRFSGEKAIRETPVGLEIGWQEFWDKYIFSGNFFNESISEERKLHRGGAYLRLWGEEIGYLGRNQVLENFKWFLEGGLNPLVPSYFFYEKPGEEARVRGATARGGIETYFDGINFGLASGVSYELLIINSLGKMNNLKVKAAAEDKITLFEASFGPKYKVDLKSLVLEFILKGEIYQEEKNKPFGYFNFSDLSLGFSGGINIKN